MGSYNSVYLTQTHQFHHCNNSLHQQNDNLPRGTRLVPLKVIVTPSITVSVVAHRIPFVLKLIAAYIYIISLSTNSPITVGLVYEVGGKNVCQYPHQNGVAQRLRCGDERDI